MFAQTKLFLMDHIVCSRKYSTTTTSPTLLLKRKIEENEIVVQIELVFDQIQYRISSTFCTTKNNNQKSFILDKSEYYL